MAWIPISTAPFPVFRDLSGLALLAAELSVGVVPLQNSGPAPVSFGPHRLALLGRDLAVSVPIRALEVLAPVARRRGARKNRSHDNDHYPDCSHLDLLFRTG